MKPTRNETTQHGRIPYLRFVALSLGLLLFFSGCSNLFNSDDDDDDPPVLAAPADSQVEVSDGYGFQEDPDDTTELSVVDNIPAPDVTGVDPGSAITLYFDDIVDPSSINSDTLTVTTAPAGSSAVVGSAATEVFGTITVSKSADGSAAIISFAAYGGLPANSQIAITLSGDALKDDGGNALGSEYSVSFQTGEELTSSLSSLGFESGTDGILISGNGGIVSMPLWGVSAIEGSHAAVITTGSISDTDITGDAIENQYSSLSTGFIAVPAGATTVKVDYYFISDEFLDFIGSVFDDNVTLTATGEYGARSVVLTSVNEYTSDDVTALTVPDDNTGDGDFFRSEVTTGTLNISGLGPNVAVSLTVTDVEDRIYTSIVLLDNIRFE